MNKLIYEELQNQLKINKTAKNAALDCLKILKELVKINEANSITWNMLTDESWTGHRDINKGLPFQILIPSKVGRIFLKGIEEKKKRETGVRYIPIQTAIASHLSDAQELTAVALSRQCRDAAIQKMNFAKQLVLTYLDASIEASEKELEELWKKNI